MIPPSIQTTKVISSPKLSFQGAETFKKRIERDKLFTHKDLPDFDLISSKETRRLLKDQVDFAQWSQKQLETSKAGSIFSRKLWTNALKKADVESAEAKLTQNGINELKKAGIEVKPDITPDEVSILQGQYQAHNKDEELGNNYGVGELSDKAVKILKEYKINPKTFTAQESVFTRFIQTLQDMWQKIKGWFTGKPNEKK